MDDNKIIERLVSVEEKAKSNTKRLDEQALEIKELSKTYSLMETMVLRIGNVEKNVESINSKLDKHDEEIQEESVKDVKKKSEWIDYIFKGILTIIIGYIAVKLGLK